MNRVPVPGRGALTFEKLADVSRRFTGLEIHYLGEIPEDPAVTHRRLGQPPLVVSHPQCRTSEAVANLLRNSLIDYLRSVDRRVYGHFPVEFAGVGRKHNMLSGSLPAGVDCPECGNDIVERRGKAKGRGPKTFYGCSGYPECKNVKKIGQPAVQSLGIQCPECEEGEIQQKYSRRGKVFYSCNRYPKCKYALWDRPIAEPCPECQAPFVVEKTTKRAGTTRRCVREECHYQVSVEQ
ncbi:MAG: topoisomerase DNA-binding C4 zinc finger domain-containing protein, partial [candidate division NC10 bacterium]|nr:topoisomerase DNA-binding C4 zinc finger domain-containing protein [candidate division NC10 bacterium]